MFSSWISSETLSFYPMPLDTGRISQPDSSSSRRVPSEPSFTVHSQSRTFRDSPVPSDFCPTLPAGSSAGSRVGSYDDFIFPSPVSPFSLQEQSLYGFPSVALPPASASTIYQPDNRDDDNDDDDDDDTQAQPDDDWQPPDDEAPDAELSMPPYACGHAGCHKSFRRKEHLKRHVQTIHGDAPAFLRCEFCGKDQFNRLDNLRSHRKLHALPKASRRGVEFVPAATRILERESHGRKRRRLW